jgi:hypothetical protein
MLHLCGLLDIMLKAIRYDDFIVTAKDKNSDAGIGNEILRRSSE